MEINDTPVEATKRYKVTGWAPVAEGIKGEPVWDVVARHLRARGTIAPLQAHAPRVN